MYDIAVIGGGPGGYAAALYAHNFGLSVALIEKDRIGGTCLLRGCIPAKAWIQSGEVFSTVKSAAEFGVNSSDPTFEWPVALERKGKVVEGLVKGLGGMLSARGVEVVDGFGSIAGEGRVSIAKADGSASEIEARSIILATGSVPALPRMFDIGSARVVDSTGALALAEIPDSLRC